MAYNPNNKPVVNIVPHKMPTTPLHTVISFILVNKTLVQQEFDLYKELKDAGAADDDIIFEIRLEVSDEKQLQEQIIIGNKDALGRLRTEILSISNYNSTMNLNNKLAVIPNVCYIVGQINQSKYYVQSNCTVRFSFVIRAGVGERIVKPNEKDVEREIHDALSEVKLDDND